MPQSYGIGNKMKKEAHSHIKITGLMQKVASVGANPGEDGNRQL